MRLLRTIRLTLNTWRSKALALFEALQLRYQRRTCPHSFRPALLDGGPGRVCRICDQSEGLTREEYYAQFGERGLALIAGMTTVRTVRPEFAADPQDVVRET